MFYFRLSPGDENVIGIRSFKTTKGVNTLKLDSKVQLKESHLDPLLIMLLELKF